MLEILYIIFITIFGLCIGSFLNVLIIRLHDKITLLGRSECPNCHHKLSAFDLVPLFSFLALKGKCRYCKEKISWQYFWVEFITALLFTACFVFNYFCFDFNIILFIRDLITVSSLVCIFVYDTKYMEVPDEISIPTAAIIAMLNYIVYKDVGMITLGATIGILFFLIQFMISKGKWIGGGDIRMGLLMGVLFGPQKVIIAIFLSYFVGAIYSIPILVNKYFNKNKIENAELDQNVLPLAPFLSIGTLLVLFFSNFLIKILS